MKKFTYTNFEDAFLFANSDDGEAFIKSHYVGETAINRSNGHCISLYKSPEAAALAALSEHSQEDADPERDRFSVDARSCDGELLYAADVGHNDSMTHTDTEGFIFFLKGRNWLDSEWVTDVYDLELSDSSCVPLPLQFDVKYPWTLHEARAIARSADELLRTPNCYYQNARPEVYELEGNQAMLIIFDGSEPKIYGILDEEGILELERKLDRFNLNDIGYADTMYKGLELCYYTSREPDCRTGNYYF